MKKNIRIASAAAAALLAVAPVAANVVNVANAAVTDSSIQTISSQSATWTGDLGSATKPYIITNVKSDQKIAVKAGSVNNITVAPNLTYGNYVDGSMKVMGVHELNGDASGAKVTTMKAGKDYRVEAAIAVSGLTSGKFYAYNRDLAGKYALQSAASDGYIGGIYVYFDVHAYSGDDTTMPYFINKLSNVVINDGATVDNSSLKANAYTNTTAVWNKLTDFSVVIAREGQIITTAKDIAAQLKNQGIDVDDKGNFDNSADKAFSITLTAKNPVSGKEVKVVVPFVSAIDQNSSFPVIKYNNKAIKQGDKTFANGNYTSSIPTLVVRKGDSNWNPIAKADKSKGFSAVYNTVNDNNKSYLDLQVVSNNVNVDVPGSYSYTVKATNSLGKTTTVTVPVLVTDVNGYFTNINYAKGYNVLVWHMINDKPVYQANGYSTVKGGSTVFATNDHKTVDGTGYTRVVLGNDNNVWIQDGYLKGSFATQEEAQNAIADNNNGEEAVSGVATVHYNGKGGVALLNAEGKYQSQWVTNGSRWRVFAKKTINGRVMYRLGTQSQWIPADYVSVN